MQVLLGAAVAALTLGAVAHAGDVTVTLEGVEARGGLVLVSLQDEAGFMQSSARYGATAAAPETTGPVTVTFTDVAPGRYALMAMHDENGDYVMQRESNGRPKEGWAMNSGATMRERPVFDAHSFEVGEDGVEITEPMIYAAGR